MKHELTLSVDEATKKTMEQINEDICNSLNEAIQSNSTLQSVDKLTSGISGKMDEILASNSENLNAVGSLSESQAKQIGDLKKAIDKLTNGISELGEIVAENHRIVTKQIQSLETKINDISLIIENQKSNSKRLDEIIEKLDYMNLPFLKKITKKRQNDSEIQAIPNKEEK
jgi:methyl-accepting chemotaxis protein